MNINSKIVLFILIAVESARCRQRIRNGMSASLVQFPFYAALRNGYGSIFCGGSIISNLHILTASHCLQEDDGTKIDPWKIKVTLGSTDMNGVGGTTYSVMSTIIHPYYGSKNMGYYTSNDVGIIELVRPIEFNANIQAIPLTKYIIDYAPLIVIGFGLSDNNNLPTNLQYTLLPSIKSARCHQGASEEPGTFCIYSQSTGHCSGDSGGPIVVVNEMRQYIQVGITSASTSPYCATSDHLIYQDVSYHRPWIKFVLQYTSL